MNFRTQTLAQPQPVSRDTVLRRGLALALLLHLALLALLSLQWPDSERKTDNPPMEVDLVAEIAPKSTAPVISPAPPAPKLGEVEEAIIPPPPPKAAPLPPVKAPAPAPVQKIQPVQSPPPKPATKSPPVKAAPVKAAPTRPAPERPVPAKAVPTKAAPAPTRSPTGRLDGITDGLTKAPPAKAAPAKAAPAAVTAAEVRKSIDVAIDGKILPHWRRNVPSGIDIDQLRVVLQIRLNPDGSLADVRQLGELTGKTESNRPQQALFVERAIRSIRQASPFNLPSEYYDQWRVWDVTFRARGI